ncbi:MAG: FHA domain-containing protein, partial [Bryobacteraceae bacterium]
MQSVPRQLIVRTPDGKSRAVPLEGDRLGVGRSGANDLSYPDDSGLSRQHMVFERREGGWVAEDLGSKNGTLVNGVRLTEPHVLQPGDRITAGHLTLEFGDESARGPETVVFLENPQEEQLVQGSTMVSTSLAGVLGTGTV